MLSCANSFKDSFAAGVARRAFKIELLAPSVIAQNGFSAIILDSYKLVPDD
jgi:hypothetical protein